MKAQTSMLVPIDGRCRGRRLRNQRGQALAEAGMVIPMLVLLMLGVFEFGRAMMVANVASNAARVGARAAAMTAPALRGTDGIPVSDTHIITAAKAMLGDVVDGDAFDVFVEWFEEDGVPMVRVRVTASSGIPFIFAPLATYALERQATFADQR